MSKPVFEDFYDFKGRRNRKSYILGFLFFWIVAFFVFGVAGFLGSISNNLITGICVIILLIGALGFYLLSVNISAQRLRDLGHSGWWSIGVVFFNIIGMFGGSGLWGASILLFNLVGNKQIFTNISNISFLAFIAAVLYLTFAKGTQGENKYGPDPLGPK